MKREFGDPLDVALSVLIPINHRRESMESPIYTPSPIRSQTRFLTELTRLRLEYEDNMSRLYKAQAEYKAAFDVVTQLIECGAPADLDITVHYSGDHLVYSADERKCKISGGLMQALDRSGIDYCEIYRSLVESSVCLGINGQDYLFIYVVNETIAMTEAIQCAA